MARRNRRIEGLRNTRTARSVVVKINLTQEEAELLVDESSRDNPFVAVWARDVLISRALSLRAQRRLLR